MKLLDQITEEIKLSPHQQLALDLVVKGVSFFITGKAGSGKSTLLHRIRDHFEKSGQGSPIVVAPTGVAAVNVGGQTVHSLFGLDTSFQNRGTNLVKNNHKSFSLIRKAPLIVIDEVSMLRADVMNAIDELCRAATRKRDIPFGGKQFVLFGDMFQLPPVVSDKVEREYFDNNWGGEFFFNAPMYWDFDIPMLELQRIYRQTGDMELVNSLNRVRENIIGPEDLELFNERVAPKPPQSVVLCTTRRVAGARNRAKLLELEEEMVVIEGKITGAFKKSSCPVPLHLELKLGARVMVMVNNKEEGYYNGSLGEVTKIYKDRTGIAVLLDTGEEVQLGPHIWEQKKFKMTGGKVEQSTVGTFAQIPIRVAFAMTIHKAQGLTLDHVHIDLGSGAFACGQTYVALSRVTTREGLTLERPLSHTDIMVDPKVVKFYRWKRNNTPVGLLPPEESAVNLLPPAPDLTVKEDPDFIEDAVVETDEPVMFSGNAEALKEVSI